MVGTPADRKVQYRIPVRFSAGQPAGGSLLSYSDGDYLYKKLKNIQNYTSIYGSKTLLNENLPQPQATQLTIYCKSRRIAPLPPQARRPPIRVLSSLYVPTDGSWRVGEDVGIGVYRT